jgi:hypothetical protein
MQNAVRKLLGQSCGGRLVPEYFFAIRRSDQEHLDEHATALNDDAAALDYACHMVRQMQANGGYDDPRLVVYQTNSKQSHRISGAYPSAYGLARTP